MRGRKGSPPSKVVILAYHGACGQVLTVFRSFKAARARAKALGLTAWESQVYTAGHGTLRHIGKARKVAEVRR